METVPHSIHSSGYHGLTLTPNPNPNPNLEGLPEHTLARGRRWKLGASDLLELGVKPMYMYIYIYMYI